MVFGEHILFSHLSLKDKISLYGWHMSIFLSGFVGAISIWSRGMHILTFGLVLAIIFSLIYKMRSFLSRFQSWEEVLRRSYRLREIKVMFYLVGLRYCSILLIRSVIWQIYFFNVEACSCILNKLKTWSILLIRWWMDVHSFLSGFSFQNFLDLFT